MDERKFATRQIDGGNTEHRMKTLLEWKGMVITSSPKSDGIIHINPSRDTDWGFWLKSYKVPFVYDPLCQIHEVRIALQEGA